MNKTTLYPAINNDCQWYIIDAESKTLGRLATEAARILLGKNLPSYNPSRDIKNALIIINADKIKVSGKKQLEKKISEKQTHCNKRGYPRCNEFNNWNSNYRSW